VLSLLDKTEEYTFPNLSTTDVVMNTFVAPKVYRTRKASYNDCREAIKDFKFKSMLEYQTWLDTSNCSDIFYKSPAQSYANNGWVSTRDFLSMTEEEYRQLKSERGRWVGTTHSSKPRKKSAPKATKTLSTATQKMIERINTAGSLIELTEVVPLIQGGAFTDAEKRNLRIIFDNKKVELGA
jgi:hypothetical protein